MQSAYIEQKIFRRQQWQRNWPIPFLTVIAIGQMFLTFTIIGLETWSMILNIKHAFLFIGYIVALLFTITWISTFTVVCCNRESRGCATHALIENILSIIASSILLHYDARFVREPWTCLWPGKLCYDIDWSFNWSIWQNNYDFDIQNAKLIAIKAQLTCAAIMLVLCMVFVLIYFYTSLKVGARLTTVNPQDTLELRLQQQFSPPPPPPPAPITAWSTQVPVWPMPSKF